MALVLILLGAHVLLKSLGNWTLHGHEHSHEGYSHSHFHLHLHMGKDGSPGHTHLLLLGGRPFLVGVLHGMAGSAALMLLVLATIPSTLGGDSSTSLSSGVGSTAGMLVISGLIGIPFILSARRSRSAHMAIQMLAGAASLVLGLALAWELIGA